MTLDHLSGGRFALGIGVSGPAVAEGWYGVPWGPPLARVREYVALLRRAWAREEPLAGPGPLYPLPLPASGAPALRSSIRPLRTDIPILLGAERPRAIALAAEICDGWLALFQSPRRQDAIRHALAEGFARPGARRTPEDFEVVVNVPVVVDDDLERAADVLRPRYALYVGGMGPRGRNFHHDAVARMGYEAEARRIQDLFLAGRREEAAAAVPTRMVEDLALIGPVAKIRHDLEAWRETPATMLLVDGPVRTLEIMAELVL
jgi:F420-dependent oxidoreductase-like protein